MPSSPFALLTFKGLIFTGLGVTISLIWKHKKCSSKTTMENLPDNVLSDIFTRLIAKRVGQMRCVCKSWNALLSDKSFIQSHLTRSLQTNDDKVLLFSRSFFSLAHGPRSFTARRTRSPNVELTNFIKLPVIREGDFGCGYLVGSVNGLVCFFYNSSFPNESVLCIWNPSLSALLSLVPCPLADRGQREFGFGYDSVSDDYKILKITPEMEVKSEVYSMRTGSWKLISQTFPSRLTIDKNFYNQVYVDGHLHWLCVSELEGNPQMIVGFDLHVETFNEIPLPNDVYKCSNVLGVLGGKLCVISEGRTGLKLEVWVMNEYGVAESWVKHDVLSRFNKFVIPYGFTSRGDFLFLPLLDPNCFGLYDPIDNKAKTFRLDLYRTNAPRIKVVEYVDSLVWVVPPTRES